MFRLQDNTPNIYTDDSRDFQLFCRLYDCINNGVMFDIDTMVNILNPKFVNDRLLELLCTRVGFFPKYSYDSIVLRYITAAFPYIIRNKGNFNSIESAVITILKAENNQDKPYVIIDPIKFTVTIYTESNIYNKRALLDVLSYVMPTGYSYWIQLGVYESEEDFGLTKVNTLNNATYLINPTISNSQVIGTDRITTDFELNDIQDISTGSLNMMEIIGTGDDYAFTGDYTEYITSDTNARIIREDIDSNKLNQNYTTYEDEQITNVTNTNLVTTGDIDG